MQLVRLCLVTIIGLGAALHWFGRDAGAPDVALGREEALIPADLMQRITGVIPEAEEETKLARALASDASPETATLVAFRPTQEPITPLAANAQPAVATVDDGETGVVGTASEPEEPREARNEKPEPTPDYLYVTGTRVNVRGGPSTSYGVISSLGEGSRVRDMGDAGDGWRTIQLADTGDRGFMAARFLSPEAP